MDITLRRIRIDDLEAVQRLCYEQVSTCGDDMNKLRISERQYAWEMKRLRQDWLVQQRYVAYVAVKKQGDEEIYVGYGAALIMSQAHFFEIETFASICELWVDPAYRGQQIGRHLVEAILNGLKNLGILWITVHLSGHERQNAGFFEKLGFDQGAVEMRRQIDFD